MSCNWLYFHFLQLKLRCLQANRHTPILRTTRMVQWLSGTSPQKWGSTSFICSTTMRRLKVRGKKCVAIWESSWGCVNLIVSLSEWSLGMLLLKFRESYYFATEWMVVAEPLLKVDGCVILLLLVEWWVGISFCFSALVDLLLSGHSSSSDLLL